MNELQAYLASIFLHKKYKTAIEVGCSYGLLTMFLYGLCKTDGIDIAKPYIDKARKNCPGIKFILGDFLKTKLGKYDVAVTHGFLIHVPPEQIEKAIKKLLKIAKEIILVESSGVEVKNEFKVKYDAGKYWNNRAKHKDKEKDLPMKYYYSHNYPAIFEKLGIKYQIVKMFDPQTLTRLYHATN